MKNMDVGKKETLYDSFCRIPEAMDVVDCDMAEYLGVCETVTVLSKIYGTPVSLLKMRRGHELGGTDKNGADGKFYPEIEKLPEAAAVWTQKTEMGEEGL